MDFIVATTNHRDELSKKVPNERDLNKVTQFLGDLATDNDKRKDLIDFLNYWEYVAAAVNTGVYDIEILNRAYGGVVIAIVNVYGDFMKKERTERNTPTIFAEVERLSKNLSKLRSPAR